jgi:hypothetical protein
VKVDRARSTTARFAPTTTASWNPHVACKATQTTLPALLGTQVGANGGALEAGGAFQPHLAGDHQRHLLSPPCFIGNESTFVQINGLVVGGGWGTVPDGDYVGALTDPSRPDITDPYRKSIHAEIDGTWRKAKVAPPLMARGGTRVDVQGFVYWDPGHVDSAFHYFSGWEIHPLSAWRVASPPSNEFERRWDMFPVGTLSPNHRPDAEDDRE